MATRPTKILLAEDDLDDADILREMLPEDDEQPFNIEWVDQVHAQAPSVPIIVLTGLEDEELARKTMRKRASDFLVKGTMERSEFASSLWNALLQKKA
jgi:FixJ family two-component response regulator